MKKVMFFAYRKEPMCFIHVLLNALDLHEKGYEAKIIFEGPAVTLPGKMQNNAMFEKAKEKGLFEGICEACSKTMEVYEENKKTGLPFLNNLKGHPSIETYLAKGYEILMM